MDVVWDMETGDPDDFLTLLLLLGHPGVRLKAVTLTPGSADQVAIVRWALAQFGVDIPLGAGQDPAALERQDVRQHGAPKPRVSPWHWTTYTPERRDHEAAPAVDVLGQSLGPDTMLVTGGPLKNLGALLATPEVQAKTPDLGRWVAQGGFAGEGVVPPDRQLDQFKGLVTCPTYNLNGAPKHALRALAYGGFRDRRFVSKNVCHGVFYDAALHAVFQRRVAEDDYPLERTRLAHRLIVQGMSAYLARSPEGKKFHDPLAACCALEPDIGEWAEVELYREKGAWGARLAPGSGTRIITGYRPERFVEVLTAR
ncbi:MAG: nucleoside hydrolase [Alphaproteobacteria bacterium]|nr:nucleoside hydrolase [Alphaproteobacteria bacterium]